MPSRTITVTAPTRLHFGLLSLGGGSRTYGGVGVMVHPPEVQIRIGPASSFQVLGGGSERLTEFAEHWRKYWKRPNLPACRIVVEAMPHMHSGLGAGTQLALSLAKGLNAYFQLESLPPESLAASVGRGVRSAVGTFGFFHGGLIYETGKNSGDSLSGLAERLAIPEAWRFVLIRAADADLGMHGLAEQQTFEQLPPTPPTVSSTLQHVVENQILPSVRNYDFSGFSCAVYEFGKQSGLSFASVQGGAYNGPLLTAIVELVRSLGVEGVGQSSWGPTIFALCPTQRDAEILVHQLQQERLTSNAELTIARPCNHGALLGEIHG